MACSDYAAGIDAVSAGAPIEFVTCTYQADLGLAFGLMASGAIIAGAFAASRSAVPPLILAILLGPIIVGSALPGPGKNLIGVAALFTVPSVLLLLYLRMKFARP